MSDTCRSCGAAIAWAWTEKGRAIPLDAAPVSNGNIKLEPTNGPKLLAIVVGPGHGDRVSHFATCPNAGEHRGNPRQGDLFS